VAYVSHEEDAALQKKKKRGDWKHRQLLEGSKSTSWLGEVTLGVFVQTKRCLCNSIMASPFPRSALSIAL
jgi:hypothetical protein